jgi:hypothetical protein
MTTGDDVLYSEMIGLLRDIRSQQETAATKASALERAMLALNQHFSALDDRRLHTLVNAVWALSAAIVIAGALIAAALVWGI